jgi:hypothetical protein
MHRRIILGSMSASRSTHPSHGVAADSGLAPLPETPLGRYRHYKGGEYEVIGVARHSETNEPLVVYRPLYNASGWWVRPHAMFFENVTIDGVVQSRFAPVAGVGNAA